MNKINRLLCLHNTRLHCLYCGAEIVKDKGMKINSLPCFKYYAQEAYGGWWKRLVSFLGKVSNSWCRRGDDQNIFALLGIELWSRRSLAVTLLTELLRLVRD
jgi:hypothetical protein